MGGQVLLVLLALSLGAVNCQMNKCDAPTDVVFLLDGSYSIKPPDWVYVKTFVEMLVNSFDIQPYAVHAGVIVYSRFIGDVISLNPYKDKESIKKMVRNLTQPRDDTNTALGIKTMRIMLRTQGRPNKPHFGIVVTDGKSTSPRETLQEAMSARQEGITMIAVGVARLFITEVKDIASHNSAFSVKDFRSLPSLVYLLRDIICAERSTTVLTTATTLPTTTVTLHSPPDIPCDMPADILFLLDASSSITSQNWITQKNFVATLINSLHIHPTTMNVGIVVFSTFIGDVVPLSPFKDKRTLVLLTKTLKQAGFGTSTNLGIAKVREIMTTQGRRSDGVPQIAIVITDGQSEYMVETIAQAKAAKDEGIIMIAVGISSHALTSELENIASSRRKVFPVADFSALSGLVNTLKDLICTAITTTTQPPPLTTTPAPNIPQLCSGCLIDNGIGYNPYPGDCSKYIQCYQDEVKFRALIKQCPFGLYWNRDSVTCEPASEVDCLEDTCRNSTDGMIHPYQGYGCRAYLTCQESHSVPTCCPRGSRFIYQMGCIQDPSCHDDCPPVSTFNLTSTCLLKEHSDKQKYVQSIPGHGSMVRPCAEGTVFSYPHCSCIKDTDTTVSGPCRPSVHYTFDQNTQDASGNNVQAGVEGVKIIGHGVGHFDGKSKMNIYQFAGKDFGQKLTIKMRYRMDGTGGDNNGNGQIMWLIIGKNGQVIRSGNGQIPVDVFRALQQGSIIGTLVRQIVSHVGSIGGSTMIWQIIGLDGSVLLSGFGPITGRTMMQIVNFRPNGEILIKWYIYASDGSVITSGQGNIPTSIIDQLKRGTIRGTIVKEVSGYNGSPRRWMVVDTSGNVLLSGTGHITQDIIMHLKYRQGGQAGNTNHTLWFVVEPQGKIVMTGTGVIPPSVFKGIRSGTIHGSLGREIVTPTGIIWQIIGLDGKVFLTGSGQIDQTVLNHIAKYSPGNRSNQVWYFFTVAGKMSHAGYGKIPQDIFNELQRGTLKGVLITYILPSNGGPGKWNIIGPDGKVVKSGSGLLTKYVVLQYLTSIQHPDGGLIWFIIGPGGNAIKSGFGDPPATIVRELAEGILRGSLVKLIVDKLGNEGAWQIMNSNGQILHTGQGPISRDVLKQLQSQFIYEPINVEQNITHLLTQWKVTMSDGTVHSGVGAIPRNIMQLIARDYVTWTVITPDGQSRTGRGKFPVELVTTYPLPDVNFGTGLTEWFIIKNGKIIQSGFGEPMTWQPNVGHHTSWTVVKEIGLNGKTSGWKLIDPDGAERDRGSGVVPSDIFYRIQYIIDPGSITTTTTTRAPPTPVTAPHGGGRRHNPVEWYIVQAGGSRGRSGFGDVPRDLLEAIRSGQHRGAIVNKIRTGGTTRWQITSSGGHVVSGVGEIPQGVVESHLMGTVTIREPEIRPVKLIKERRWRVTFPDGTVRTGIGEIPASITQSLANWKLTMPDGSTQTGTGSVPAHMLQGISSGTIRGSFARPDDIQPITKSIETVTARPSTMTYWKITLRDGKVHSGMGQIPTNFLRQVNRWLVMSTGGIKESGTGNIPEHVLKLTNGASFRLQETGTPVTGGRSSLIGGVIQSISAPGSWSIALSDGSVNSGTGPIPPEILAKAKGPRVRWALTLQDQSVKSGTGSIPQNILQLMLPTSNIVPVKKDQGTFIRESSAVSGRGRTKTQMHWTISQPDGSSKTGTGPIPTDLLQTVQGSSTRWTVIGPDGKSRSGFGKIPSKLLQVPGFTSNTASGIASGLQAVTGKTYSRWSVVLPDGSVKTGSGKVPADILSKLSSNSQWTVVDSHGQVRTGSGIPPGMQTGNVKIGTAGGSVHGINQRGGSSTFIRRGKVVRGNRAEVDMFADGRGMSSSGLSGVRSGTQGKTQSGSFELNRKFIGPLQYDLVPIRGTSRRIRRRAKWNKKTRSLWQSGHHQALVANCGGRRKGGASVMILANNQEIIFSLKTTNTAKAVILSMAAKPGLNDIELGYDGNYLTGVVNGAKRSVPLSGNIEKRLAGMTLGSCEGFPSFHGNMDDFSLYECNP